MRMTIGRKQNSKNDEWLYAMQHIEELISPQEVTEYADRAIERIAKAVSGKTAAYAWSAGKDSIVLGKLCERAGVTESFFGHCDLEFPAFLTWALKHAPQGCEIINTGLDLDWLAAHPDLMFVDDAHNLNRWYGYLQRKTFSTYFENHDVDLLIVGHRIIDGNTCGKDFYIRKNSGETRFAAIADWPHEAILGYIHYHGLELPPTYNWEDGWVFGPTPWPIWGRPESHIDGFRMIYEIDPSIVIAAADKIPVARTFLTAVDTRKAGSTSPRRNPEDSRCAAGTLPSKVSGAFEGRDEA